MADELPYSHMSIVDFCKRAKGILDVEDHAGFVKFVLTGQHGAHQAVVDPVLNKMGEYEGLSVLRDYDSLLGISADICVNGHLTVYPVSRREDTLVSNIHLKHSFESSKVSWLFHYLFHNILTLSWQGRFTAPIHKIPNLCIAKWGTHNCIRVLIPELYSEERKSGLTQDEQRTFYECGLLPAVQNLWPDRSAEWPITYDDEMFRARGRNGQLSMQSKVTTDWMTSYLGDYIRDSLEANDLTWGHGLVFLHQIRGVKNSSVHPVTHNGAEECLETFLKENLLLSPDAEGVDELLDKGDWWVDVALEVASEEDRCLAWRTDSHFGVVQRATGISEHDAERITSVGSSKYIRDMAMHLPAVSGCRITPGHRGQGEHSVQYLQMYTTDKAHIYRLDQGHHGKFIPCVDILNSKGITYANQLYKLYCNASVDTPCQARLEVRVPLARANAVLLNIDEGLLYDSLLSFTPRSWW